jgi:hypothetical protein
MEHFFYTKKLTGDYMFPKCINDLIKDKELIEIKDFHRSGDLFIQ